MKKITVLGSTGSIGTQTLEIVRDNPDLQIAALAAGQNVDLMEKQVREFSPRIAGMWSEAAAKDLRERIADLPVKVVCGMDGLLEIASMPESDVVVTAVVGMIGIRPTIAAIESKKTIALANKETLVTAGHLIMPLAAQKGVPILPVDSEHSAIFQSLQGSAGNRIHRILLTASGGPFRGMGREDLERMSLEDALKHPNWSMGKKVTIDSASLVNKGLEVMGNHVTYDPNHLVNDGQPVTLEWWLWDAPDLFGQMAEAYMEIHPNVTINIINNPWDGFWTKLPLALQKGEKGPTLFNVHNSYQHLLLPYMAPYDIDLDQMQEDFFTAASHVIDGQIYYTDFGVMTGAIYYNKEMWAAAGLTQEDIPKTWDEFREVAKKLTIVEDGKMVQAGFNYNGDFQNLMLGVPYQYGGTIFKEDMQTVSFTGEGMIKTAKMLKDMYLK